MKGAFALYLSGVTKYQEDAIKYLNYFINDNRIKSIIDSILDIFSKNRICILDLLTPYSLDNVIPYIMYYILQGQKIPSCLIEFVIKNYLDKLPYTEVDGCKLFIIEYKGKKNSHWKMRIIRECLQWLL